MNVSELIDRLERFPWVLEALVGAMTSDEALRRPSASDWSVLEIISHLVDEEIEDFRLRLRSTLEDPDRAWALNDLDDVSEKRAYRENDLVERLARFATERGDSIEWLRSLNAPDWSLAYEHPQVGKISAGDLLASWAAHDQLHLRQLAKRLYEQTISDATDVAGDYAGAW